jgi:hypothetical protein
LPGHDRPSRREASAPSDHWRGRADGGRGAREEVPRQQQHVVRRARAAAAAGAGTALMPVEEIGAEQPGPTASSSPRCVADTTRTSEPPHARCRRPGAPRLLEHAQQLHLEEPAGVRDLSEEQRAC